MMAPLKSTVEVKGDKYLLQHPGTRAWIQVQHTLNEMTPSKNGEILVRMNMEKLLDYCFEFVITPEGHDFSPSLDNVVRSENPIDALEAVEAWQLILPRFLRGSFESVTEVKTNNVEDGERDRDSVSEKESSQNSEEDQRRSSGERDVERDSSGDNSSNKSRGRNSARYNRAKRGR